MYCSKYNYIIIFEVCHLTTTLGFQLPLASTMSYELSALEERLKLMKTECC